ncbi:response regulator [Parasphingopyxis marina]|uniref:Response regulator n=1 Tax=Parasphingopyxis marina TaxID=2761622 RepID=A0A842HWZ1_9SPHN|nr:response regulator [Parasphingopyxis marina]MBC2776983.1 response regulator [Parasphingopyxis marina]
MASLGEQLAPHLPLLRRFSRALTGNQQQGDAFVRLTLETIVAAPDMFPTDVDPRLGLYRQFLDVWASTRNADVATENIADEREREGIASARLAMIDMVSRQALLLAEVEGFGIADIGYLLDRPVLEVEALIADARAEIEGQLKTDVLIIEDEPIIAMDLESIVRDVGHEVTGIAVTRDEAVAEAHAKAPGLVLADIQLADDSSGIDAVQDILTEIDVPVIFITAFPERLLTGERPEPAFLITKPFLHSTVKAAIAQALFFNRATLPLADA